ncbi:MAG TPA: hypothetical protein VN903_40330, partial [Polyangia bacterium]|nr:hypothetical protein [Polyangia bacterium]
PAPPPPDPPAPPASARSPPVDPPAPAAPSVPNPVGDDTEPASDRFTSGRALHAQTTTSGNITPAHRPRKQRMDGM